MDSVFVLQHVAREDQEDGDVKFIGVYSSRRLAEAAIDRLVLLPGFADFHDGFHIDEYEIDRDQWVEGFV